MLAKWAFVLFFGIGLGYVGLFMGKNRWIRISSFLLVLVAYGVIVRHSYFDKILSTAEKSRVGEKNSLVLHLDKSSRPRLIQFGPPDMIWGLPKYPDEIEISGSTDGKKYEPIKTARMAPTLVLSTANPIRFLKFNEVQESRGSWLASPIEVFH